MNLIPTKEEAAEMRAKILSRVEQGQVSAFAEALDSVHTMYWWPLWQHCFEERFQNGTVTLRSIRFSETPLSLCVDYTNGHGVDLGLESTLKQLAVVREKRPLALNHKAQHPDFDFLL